MDGDRREQRSCRVVDPVLQPDRIAAGSDHLAKQAARTQARALTRGVQVREPSSLDIRGVLASVHYVCVEAWHKRKTALLPLGFCKIDCNRTAATSIKPSSASSDAAFGLDAPGRGAA